jgi:hypothetical protein
VSAGAVNHVALERSDRQNVAVCDVLHAGVPRAARRD